MIPGEGSVGKMLPEQAGEPEPGSPTPTVIAHVTVHAIIPALEPLPSTRKVDPAIIANQ